MYFISATRWQQCSFQCSTTLISLILSSFRAFAHYEPKTSIFLNKIASKKRFLTLFECSWEKSYRVTSLYYFLGWFGCTRAGLEPWLEPIWLEILMMDFGWSRNWIALEISLKILDFYVENGVVKDFWLQSFAQNRLIFVF